MHVCYEVTMLSHAPFNASPRICPPFAVQFPMTNMIELFLIFCSLLIRDNGRILAAVGKWRVWKTSCTWHLLWANTVSHLEKSGISGVVVATAVAILVASRDWIFSEEVTGVQTFVAGEGEAPVKQVNHKHFKAHSFTNHIFHEHTGSVFVIECMCNFGMQKYNSSSYTCVHITFSAITTINYYSQGCHLA